MKILLLLSLLSLISCSDADKGAYSALGKTREVKCYSGGKLIYSGSTTGKIENEGHSDGYYFTDIAGEYVEVSGDCLFTLKK